MNIQHFVIFDTETTGLSPRLGDGIIEIAAMKIDKEGNELGTFQSFVNPRIPINPVAEKIHGYSDAFIARNGKPVSSVIPEFVQFSENCILVGHNIIKFDIPFVNKHLEELSLQKLNNNVLDTLHLSQRHLSLKNHKLKTVAEHFNIPYLNAHKAFEDVKITKNVFIKLIELSDSL